MNDEFIVNGLKFNVGEYSNSVEEAIHKAKTDRLVERVWGRDHTLWKPGPEEISNRLGWLDIAERMRTEIPALQNFVEAVKSNHIDRVLLLGMGGSSLAPELFSQMFGGHQGLVLSVLDSTDPGAVLEKERSHDPTNTLYIASSKSGSTVETSSFFRYFYNRALTTLGAAEVGKHFVAITDPGSDLAKIGGDLGFRHIFLADPNIGGRYSALSHFGLVPAALVGVDLDRLLTSTEKMAELCKEKTLTNNPGAMLGLAIGTLALKGRDKVSFRLPEEKQSFEDWVEQLIAESTGKEGKAILPIVREPALDDKAYGNDRVFISLEAIRKSPQIELEWKDDYEIGAQFFLWEFATAVAGYVLGINPFDQPNVESAKNQARTLIEGYKKSGKLPNEESEKSSWSTIERFINGGQTGDYIALQVYAAPNSELSNAIQLLRSVLSRRTHLATTFGYGPRFLHSTGQLHKGDRGNGLFIQFITPASKKEVPTPAEAGKGSSDLSFGLLKTAQALGDAQALRAAGRRVLSLEIEGDPIKAINALITEASR